MLRRIFAVCIAAIALIVAIGAAAQQAPAPAPASGQSPAPPPPSGGATPQAGRGGDPNAPIGAPPAINVIEPPALNAPNVGAGAISGVVTDAATGTPLEGAVVSLTGSGSPGQPLVNRPRQMTDSKGRFIFPNLLPSTAYSLHATRPGYLSGAYRQLAGVSDPDPIKLADGEWFREANVKLSRPGAISGTVRDERGEPFVGVPIRILVGATVAGRLRWASGPVTQTDDRGMYRFAGLAKGRYLVHVPSIQITLPSGEVALYRPPATANAAGAAAPNQTRDALNVIRAPDGSGVVAGLFADALPDDKGSVYASVFHPAARSVDQAEPIALEFGADRTGVDMQMTPVPSVSVSGTVTGPTDAGAGIPVRILPVGNELLGQAGDTGLTVTDGGGRFVFHRIPAGDYVIIASSSVADYRTSSGELLPAQANAFNLLQTFNPNSNGIVLDSRRVRGRAVGDGRLQVSVANRPVSGLVIPVTPTVSVSGQIEWDGSNSPPAALSQALVLVGLEPADGDVALGQFQMPARTNPPDTSRTFTFEYVKPGRYVLANVFVGAPNPGTGFPARSHRLVGVTWNERDIIGTPLEITGDGPVTGIVLRMSSQINNVTGTVRGADGRAATEGAVIAFPPSPAALLDSGLSAIRFRMAGIATDGTYELPPMIPGEYFIAAISMDDRARWLEPEFLASVSRQATRVSLGPASVLSQDLRIVNVAGGQR